MFKYVIKTLLTYKMLFKPLVRFNSYHIGNMQGVNLIKRDVPLIVSLSADQSSFSDLELSLYSVFNQTVTPDRVILWLNSEYELSELPYFVTRYIKNGLEIKFVADYGVYNKLIYSLKEFENSVNVLADEKIYYQRDWLEKLYHSYISSPNDIHINLAARVKRDKNEIFHCKDWDFYISTEEASFDNFAILEGGILLPPNCFSKEVFRNDIYLKKTKAKPAVWIWFMSLVSNRKLRVVKNHIARFFTTDNLKIFKLTKNISKECFLCDRQISRLMGFYAQNIRYKFSNKSVSDKI